MADGYLVDTPEREHEALQRLLQVPALYWNIFSELGLAPTQSWYLLQVKHSRLVKSLDGDVDILAGRLQFKTGGANEVPTIDTALSSKYLVGIEAKCSFLPAGIHPDERSVISFKSTKSSTKNLQKVRRQVEKLQSMGFDRVALLDIIANPPATGEDQNAWFEALENAVTSIEHMLPVLKYRLPKFSTAGHWVWSCGAVVGGNEAVRGAGAPFEMRRARYNRLYSCLSKEVRARRREMEINLQNILKSIPLAHPLPLVGIDCNKCGEIHLVGDCRENDV